MAFSPRPEFAPLRRLFRFFFLAVALLLAPLSLAHEFWIRPDNFAPALNAPVAFTLSVGENFAGESRPFTPDRAEALRHFSSASPENLLPLVPPAPGTSALVTLFATPGTHVVAYDSRPSTITLSADQFNAYLREDGLTVAAAAREKNGTVNQPGRERYRRCVKTLLHVGGATDAAFSVATGQRLELIPLTDPFKSGPGDTLRAQLRFNQKPLARALVRAWHHDGERLMTLDATTDANGIVSFTLTHPGPWLLSTVHMIPATGDPAIDWESFWCSLTFNLPAPRAFETP